MDIGLADPSEADSLKRVQQSMQRRRFEVFWLVVDNLTVTGPAKKSVTGRLTGMERRSFAVAVVLSTLT